MKPLAFLAIAGLTLAACTNASSPLAEDCIILAADPEAQENFVEMGTDTDGFCDCVIKYVDDQPETEQRQMRLTMERVADGMEASGEGAEEVVGRLVREIMMSQATQEDKSDLEAGISLVGEMIDDIDNGFEDTGACPVS